MILLAALIACEISLLQQPTFNRGQDFTLPISSDTAGGDWGLGSRNADHATVAINSNLDIFVVYQTARLDTNPSWDLKQVEGQLYEWNGSNSWSRVGVMLLGDIDYDVIPTTQPKVRCERPDVTAIGERFFVTWTRRYSRNFDPAGSTPPFEEEPAVLEGTWIQKEAGTGWTVYDSGSPGLGIELDRDSSSRHFWIRECSGVPDVVALTQDSSTGLARVGIAYPHQYDFGDWAPPPSQPDGSRECDLRFITCTITGTANATITKDANPFALKQAIKFSGTGTDDSGFILPDLAPSAPSLENSILAPRFVMAYEEQFHVGPLAGDVDGRIRVAQWEWNGVS